MSLAILPNAAEACNLVHLDGRPVDDGDPTEGLILGNVLHPDGCECPGDCGAAWEAQQRGLYPDAYVFHDWLDTLDDEDAFDFQDMLRGARRVVEGERLDAAAWARIDRMRAEEAAAFEREAAAWSGFADYTIPVTPRADGEAKEPVLVERKDGATILYAGKLSSLYGEPGLGKSWAALMMALDAMRLHNASVIWWDWEDTARTLAGRAATLGALGYVQSDRFKFLAPAIADDSDALEAARAWATHQPATLVVIDAAESAGCPSDGSAVGEWFRKRVDPWRDAGCAVLLLDHVQKKKEDRPRGGIGSQYKLAHIDGAALYLTGAPWTKNANGRLKLVNQKDRPGDLPAALNKTLTTLVGRWEGGALTYAWELPDAEDAADLEAELIDALEEAGEVRGSKALRDLVKGHRWQDVQKVVDALRKEGMIEREKDGRAYVYRIAGPDGDIEAED